MPFDLSVLRRLSRGFTVSSLSPHKSLPVGTPSLRTPSALATRSGWLQWLKHTVMTMYPCVEHLAGHDVVPLACHDVVPLACH